VDVPVRGVVLHAEEQVRGLREGETWGEAETQDWAREAADDDRDLSRAESQVLPAVRQREDLRVTLHTLPISIDPDRCYAYYHGGIYRPLGVAKHVHTHQPLVIYQGVDGEDRGNMYACPLVDWNLKFSPMEEVVAIAEKAVGLSSGKPKEDRTGEGFL
jgi:hypothetical protein